MTIPGEISEVVVDHSVDGGFDDDEVTYYSECTGTFEEEWGNGALPEGFSEETEDCASMNRDLYSNWEMNECLSSYFRFFGSKDMDIIYLYFIAKKKQEDLMRILGKSQPAVSYDVTRIRDQIDFVVKMVYAIDDFILFITDPSNTLPTADKEMLTLFFYSTSIVKTSRLMGMSNITCRSHLNTVINHLLGTRPDMYHLFKYILGNLNNIKKYVARPRRDDGAEDADDLADCG